MQNCVSVGNIGSMAFSIRHSTFLAPTKLAVWLAAWLVIIEAPAFHQIKITMYNACSFRESGRTRRDFHYYNSGRNKMQMSRNNSISSRPANDD